MAAHQFFHEYGTYRGLIRDISQILSVRLLVRPKSGRRTSSTGRCCISNEWSAGAMRPIAAS